VGGDFLSGIPIEVDVARIERELVSLWKGAGGEAPGGGAAAGNADAEATPPAPLITRACLSNLIVVLPLGPEREKAAELLPAVARRFPSRIFLLGRAGPGEQTEPLRAWVSAVCHLPAPGAPPVCCEEIRIAVLEGSLDLLSGVVVPLLVPDVPTILVLLGPGGDLLPSVSAELDRVIFDSRGADLEGLRRLRDLWARLSSCERDDLAWRDSIGWRRTVCDLFDEPSALPLLDRISALEVSYSSGGRAGGAPGGRPAARAALLLGWIASRLGYRPPAGKRAAAAKTGVPPHGGAPFVKEGRALETRLVPVERQDVRPGLIVEARLAFGTGPDAPFVVLKRLPARDVLRIEHCIEASCVLPQLIAFQPESAEEALGSAVERPTHQGVLLEALEAACAIQGA
jgi:glucose-6-phosphate dehydrogenase assembly protein OpcA